LSFSLFLRKVVYATLLGAVFAVPAIRTMHGGASAAPPPGATLGPSGLPLPRFVSLKADRVNVRVGPSFSYPVDWLYLKEGLPVEILQEYDTWRKIRDSDGTEGWVNKILLSGRRTGIVTPWQEGKKVEIPLRADPDKEARAVAFLQPGIIGQIRACNGTWCEMSFSGHRGWINQNLVWGAYPGELFKE
jgi:SH3-like domain-containing protein